jgi:hypothetical protein
MNTALATVAAARPPKRFLEFFTVNIRNRHARAAYARAARLSGLSDLAARRADDMSVSEVERVGI